MLKGTALLYRWVAQHPWPGLPQLGTTPRPHPARGGAAALPAPLRAPPARQQPLLLRTKPSRTQISACTSCINVRSALGTAPFVSLRSQDERRALRAGW